jgi:hypothetical protein
MNVFIIRLALSYINVVEAQQYFSIKPEESILVIMTKDTQSVDSKHIQGIIDLSLWKQVHYMPYNLSSFIDQTKDFKTDETNPFKRKYLASRKMVKKFNKVIPTNTKIDRVFISNEFTASMKHFVNIANPQEIINIDEGFKTYTNIKNKFTQSNFDKIPGHLNEWCKGLFFNLITGYKTWPISNVKYFTSYGVNQSFSNKIILNTFQKTRLAVREKEKKDQVLFLGQSLSELSFIESDSSYIEIIRKIRDHYLPLQMIYQAHRDEKIGKLKKISESLNIEVQHATIPIEYKIITSDYVPTIVASFYSSALQNINHIYGHNVNAQSIYIPNSRFSITDNEKSNEIENAYKYLRRQELEGISIIDLEL